MPVYAEFLKNRTPDSLAIYFGIAISPDYVDRLMDTIVSNSKCHRIIVAENDELEIVGTVHVAFMSEEEVELGFMVAESHRKMGISNKLMDYVLTWCQNRSLTNIYMHCLSHNEPIIHLVKKYGLEVTKDYGDADARVTLPQGNIFTYQHELILKQTSEFANITRKNAQTFRKILEKCY